VVRVWIEVLAQRRGCPGATARTWPFRPWRDRKRSATWLRETQAHGLARDIRTLTQWLRHDVLALAGPALATRRELFDLIVAELAAREPEDMRRIRPVRVALQNRRDTLLAFAGVLDAKGPAGNNRSNSHGRQGVKSTS